MLKRGQTFQRRGPQKIAENSREHVCHKCGSPDHFLKFCPLWTLEHKRNNSDKTKDVKNDKYIPTNRRMTNQDSDLMSKEESEDEESENQSLLVIEQTDKYEFLALVAIAEREERESSCQTQETI
ncbi:hypothetical protein KY289_016247 [Solanum tuberosum]|nr:hypothetical protein KY289_016247 [Solanum tuberosum]